MLKKVFYIAASKILLPLYLVRFNGIFGFRQYLKNHGIQSGLLLYIYDDYFAKRGGYVGLGANFLGEPCLPHGWFGIFISNGAIIGKNCVIFQHVTIGSNSLNMSNSEGSPILGDNIYIGAGAKLIGSIKVGDNCRIGANAVVYKNIPNDSVAIQSTTRVIQKERLDNRYFTYRNGRKVFFDDGKWIIFEPN